MAQRNLFSTPQMPTMDHDRIWNHRSYRHPHLQLGSTAVLRPNNFPSSTFSNNMVPNSGPFHGPYLHLSSSASSSRFLLIFNQHRSSLVHHQTETGRAGFKRKSPVILLAYGGGSTSGCYNAGSSSSLHMSANPLHPKPTAMPQYGPLDPVSIIHINGSDNFLSAGDYSHRIVRRRHVQINPAVAYSSGDQPLHFHASRSSPGFTMEGQLSHLPIMPIAPQGGENCVADFMWYLCCYSFLDQELNTNIERIDIMSTLPDLKLNYEANQSVGGSTRHQV